MLASANRIVRGDDFRDTIRRGRKAVTETVVVYRRATSLSGVRFGFVVSKAVGNAVVRNRVRRRLRASVAGLLHTVGDGSDVVVRALPRSASASWVTLNADVFEGMNRGVAKA